MGFKEIDSKLVNSAKLAGLFNEMNSSEIDSCLRAISWTDTANLNLKTLISNTEKNGGSHVDLLKDVKGVERAELIVKLVIDHSKETIAELKNQANTGLFEGDDSPDKHNIILINLGVDDIKNLRKAKDIGLTKHISLFGLYKSMAETIEKFSSGIPERVKLANNIVQTLSSNIAKEDVVDIITECVKGENQAFLKLCKSVMSNNLSKGGLGGGENDSPSGKGDKLYYKSAATQKLLQQNF